MVAIKSFLKEAFYSRSKLIYIYLSEGDKMLQLYEIDDRKRFTLKQMNNHEDTCD